MTNPLGTGAGAPFRQMQIGETRALDAKDKNTGAIIKTYTLTRTARPYAYDLADAYNRERPAHWEASGLHWDVTEAGELALHRPFAALKAEAEALADKAERARRDFIHRQRHPITGD